MNKKLKAISIILIMAMFLSLTTVFANAEAGLSESLRDGETTLFEVGLVVFVGVGMIILTPILLVLSLMLGEEAVENLLNDFVCYIDSLNNMRSF